MARKTNTLKMPLESRGQAAVNRQPMPLAVAPYLAQLRSHYFKVSPPRPRLQVALQIEEQPQAPRVVKIIHIGSI